MSYEFTLNFIHAVNCESAFRLALETAEAAYSCLQEILEDNTYYIPAIRNCCDASNTDKYWLEAALKMQFVFWPAENLLALSGEWPAGVLKALPRQVLFQNSTDQDYDFDTWDGICGLMNWHVDHCRNANKETVKLLLQNHYGESFQIDEEEELELDYYRRWAAYVSIYDSFKLDDWLYGRNNPKFIRFALSPLTSQEREFEAWMKLRNLIQNRSRKNS